MKKYIIISLLFLVSFSLSAQSFIGGMSFGFTATQISGDNLSGYDRLGFVGGLFVDRWLSSKSGVKFQMGYMQKGSRKNPHPDQGDYHKYVLNLHYLELPVLYLYKMTNKIQAQGGLGLGVLIGSKEKDEYGELIGMNPFYSLDLSTYLGLGYTLNDSWSISFLSGNSVLPVRAHAGGGATLFNRGQYNSSLVFQLHRRF